MAQVQRLGVCILISTILIALAGYIKFSIALGTHTSLFSAFNIIGPLCGFWGNSLVALITVLLIKKSIFALFWGSSFFTFFSTGIPTVCAAGYWSSYHRIIRFFIPLCCIIAFIMHPVGAQAWIYAAYWLIPLAIYFTSRPTLFGHALACTFIQHAVGTVIWLYCMPTTPSLWLNLLPVVIIERLLFASGMSMVICGIRYVQKYCTYQIPKKTYRTSIFN